jgi:4-hydroxymandelate oxidase
MKQDFDWPDIEAIAERTSLPVIVKGLLSPLDARLAVEHGAKGIVVSNHGGRQLDTTIATIDALPAVAAEVGEDAEVYLDSGVRRGVDVLKALALGAKAVMVGRPVAWGLAVGGEDGVLRVLGQLVAETGNALQLSGCRSPEEAGPDLIHRV